MEKEPILLVDHNKDGISYYKEFTIENAPIGKFYMKAKTGEQGAWTKYPFNLASWNSLLETYLRHGYNIIDNINLTPEIYNINFLLVCLDFLEEKLKKLTNEKTI